MAVHRSAIPVSVDLAESAEHLWEFLRLIDSYPWLYEGVHVHNAVRRYERYWLPLAAKVASDGHTQLLLSAPLDIEWVWYVHMLSPYAYHRDCLHRFGQVITHKITSTKDRNIGLNNAKEIWEKLFRREKFTIDLTTAPKTLHKFTSKFSYDLYSAISRQRYFSYQVALKHYSDNKFLERAVKRYKEFLCAKLQDPSTTLNSCFDVQFIWHVHMIHPTIYRDDTRKIFGEMLAHYHTDTNSGLNSTAGMTLSSPVRKSTSTSCPKPICGAMYRGEAIICTPEKITLTQQQKEELTFKVKLLREEFHHMVAIAKHQRARELTMSSCWFELPSLATECSSHVVNLTSSKTDRVYNVKVTHSLAPILSTVEVIHPKDYLIAIAHTIAGKQLPIRSQLENMREKCCGLNAEAKERAMLIRSQKDWAIIVGKWIGNNEQGQLVISFFNLETNTWQDVKSSTQAECSVYEVKIFGEQKPVFINLGNGMITVPYNEIATFIPEIIALAYSIGILYVLCRERSEEFYPSEPFISTEQRGLQPCPLVKQIKACKNTKRDGVFGTSNSKKSLWLNRDPQVSSLLLATGRNCPWLPSNTFLTCFHDTIRQVFRNCTTECDKLITSEALMEMNSVLENLGIKKAVISPVKKKNNNSSPANKGRDRKEKKRGSSTSSDALRAAKERFSNVRLNDDSDGEQENRRRAKSMDALSYERSGETDGRRVTKERRERRKDVEGYRSDSEMRSKRRTERMEDREDNERRIGREVRNKRKYDMSRAEIEDDLNEMFKNEARRHEQRGKHHEERNKRDENGTTQSSDGRIKYGSRNGRSGHSRRNMNGDLSDEMTESSSRRKYQEERNERRYEEESSGIGSLRRYDIRDDLSEGMTVGSSVRSDTLYSERSERSSNNERNDMNRKINYQINKEQRKKVTYEDERKRKENYRNEREDDVMVNRMRDEGRRYKQRYEQMNGGVRNDTTNRMGNHHHDANRGVRNDTTSRMGNHHHDANRGVRNDTTSRMGNHHHDAMEYVTREHRRGEEHFGRHNRQQRIVRDERKSSDDYSEHDSVFV